MPWQMANPKLDRAEPPSIPAGAAGTDLRKLWERIRAKSELKRSRNSASGSSAPWIVRSTDKSASMARHTHLYKVDSRRKNRRGKHGAWAREVISRDHATCQGCRAQNVEMHAHHIRPFAQHPELRWDVTNGQTLCYRCHWDHHTKDGEGPAGRIEESRVSSEGVTKEGRAFRRWVGQCTECEVFISRRFSDVKDKTAIFCSLACRGKWTSRIMKGKPRNLPFPKP